MKNFSAAMMFGAVISAPAFASDLYRCDMVNGKTTYQGTQCGMDAQQRAIDPKNARREQIKRTLDEQRRNKEEKVTPAKDEAAQAIQHRVAAVGSERP